MLFTAFLLIVTYGITTYTQPRGGVGGPIGAPVVTAQDVSDTLQVGRLNWREDIADTNAANSYDHMYQADYPDSANNPRIDMDINGGRIDGTPTGVDAPSTGAFTALTSYGGSVGTEESYALANEINGILSDALAIWVWATPTTTELDQSGEGHTATYVNVDAADWLRHGSVRSLHLEAAEYLSVVDHNDWNFLDGGGNDASVSFGGRAKFYSDDNVKSLLTKYNSGSSLRQWTIQCNTTEVLQLSFYDESTGAYQTRRTDVAITDGLHEWVITYDETHQGTDASDGMTIYIDGQVVASNTAGSAGAYTDKEDLAASVGVFTRLGPYGDDWQDEASYMWVEQSCLSAADVFTLWSATRRYVDMDSGIADNDILEIDGTDIADDEYARMTAYGVESRTAAEVATDIDGSITNAPSLVETGTVTTGTWSSDANIAAGDTVAVLSGGNIKLPTSGILTDGQYAAVRSIRITAGYGTTAFADLVYLDGAADNDKLEKAQANAAASAADVLVGLVVEAVATDKECLIMLEGTMTNDTWEWTSIGASLWISDTTAGALIATKPDTANDIVRPVAYVLDNDTIYFHGNAAYATVE